MPSHTLDRTSLLLRGLLFNMWFSAACALALLGCTPEVSALMGGAAASALRILAIALLGFAAFLGITRRKLLSTPERLEIAALIVALDWLWVIGSGVLLLLLRSRLSNGGSLLVTLVALVVGALALTQWRGIRRCLDETDANFGTRHRISLNFEADAPTDTLWEVIADLGSISRYAPGLSHSVLSKEVGPGAVRTCSNHRGQQWNEEIILFEPKQFEFGSRVSRG